MLYPVCSYFSNDFEKCLRAYISGMKNERSAVETWNIVKILCEFAKKDYFELDGADVTAYFDYMRVRVDRGTLKASTVNSRKSVYNRLSYFIIDNYPEYPLTNHFALIRPLPNKAQIMPSMIPSLTEIDAVLESSKQNSMYYCIMTLAFRAALSATSIITLCLRNVQTIDGKIYINFSGEYERIIPLPDDVAAILTSYMASVENFDEAGHLFYNSRKKPLTLRSLDKAVEKYVSASGISKRYTLKDLRSRAILDMVRATDNAGGDLNAVADYAGIRDLRLNTYVAANRLVEECPADLVNLRVVDALGEQEDV